MGEVPGLVRAKSGEGPGLVTSPRSSAPRHAVAFSALRHPWPDLSEGWDSGLGQGQGSG